MTPTPNQQIAFVLNNVTDYQTLVVGIPEGTTVYILDAGGDVLTQMSTITAAYSNLDAIHLLSHGSSGTIDLGLLSLTEANLNDYTDILAQIGTSLSETGDILLYGCNIADGVTGADFIGKLAKLTESDIAASDDATGISNLGGNWTLETTVGNINALPLTYLNYNNILAAGTVTFTSNPNTDTVTDGIGGSTDISGIVLQITSNLGSNWTYESPYSAGNVITVGYNPSIAQSLITIKSSDVNTNFWFKSLFIVDSGGTPVKIEGFDNSFSTGFVNLDTTLNGYENTFNNSSGLTSSNFNNVDEVRITPQSGSEMWIGINNIQIDNAVVPGPTVTDANISISGATGTGGVFKIGDTITATWNNTAGGDNNTGVSGVTVDFSAFGGGAAVVASNSSETWSATYTIVAGAIDGTNKNVSIAATNGSITTTADTSNATIDNIAPTVTDAKISLSGASGTAGAFKIGDTITATWNNTAGGDNNSDTISGVTVDFSTFGGGTAVVASNSSGTWSATYTIVEGAIDGTNKNVTLTATDNAGNTKTTADTTNATLDNIAPSVTDSNISISGATGTGGVFKIGDTITATWNNTVGGDNNSDTISSATVDFSAFGGGAAVVASNSSGTWSATYTIVAGAIDGANKNVTLTATDNAGNTKTTADTTNATLDNIAPTITFGSLSFSADTGTSSTDFITKTAAQTINATLSGAPAGSDIVYGSLDNGSTWSDITSKVSGTTLAWDGVTLSSSSTLKLKVTDAVGNDGTSASQAYILDTTAPTTTIATKAFSADTGSSSTDFITKTAAQTISGTLSGVTVTGEIVQVSLDNGSTWATATNVIGQNSWSLAGQTLSTSSTIHVRVSDAAGNNATASTQAYILDTSVPTDMALSNSTASTSGGTNAVVGALSSTDATVGDTFTYALVAGTGDTNNASFNINGSNLRVNDPSVLGAGTYSVLVRTTDVAGNSYDEAQSITITTNPTVTISADDSSLKAGQTATITFTFSQAPTGFDASDITVSGGTLGAVSSSSATVYTATYTPVTNTQSISETILIAADTFTGSGNNNLVSNTLSITGDTFAPTVVSIDRQTPSGATTNIDSLVYRVTFAEAVSAIDTTDFSVTGTTATATNVSSAGGNAYDITVSGGDLASANGTVTLAFAGGQNITDTAGNTLSVTTPSGTNNVSYTLDNTAPIVSSVNAPNNGTFGLGSNLDFVVNFDDNVTVDTGGGTPRIALDIGGSTVYASYLSGSGTSALIFRYTTQAGDMDTDGIVVGALSANSGTLRDAVGNNATLTLNSVAATTAVLVNTAPTVTLSTNNASIAEAAGSATITATLSAVASTDTTVTLTPTGTASGTDYTLSSTTITITAGNTTGTATLTAVQDTTYEGNETVILDITGVSGGDSAYESGTQKVTVTITDDDAAPSAPSTTSTPTTTVDGATLTTTTATDANGNTTEAVIISAVPVNRINQTGAENTADIPLFWGESSRTDWATTANLPTGIGLSATGARSPQTGHTIANALSDLTAIINEVTPTNDPSKTNMLSGASNFLQSLNNITDNLVVNQITLTSTNTTASSTPISIIGIANAVHTTSGNMVPTEALVVDARALPAGSILELQNVEFTVILGNNLTIRGGEGQNKVFAGEGSQDIMCGADDDELHAGAGDDTVGSAGGDDLIFGEAGDDTVFAGEGNDLLHGGSGVDKATYTLNMSDYLITRDEGKTYVSLVSNPNEKDTLINTETIEFADATYTVENRSELTKIATLYTQILGRQAEIDGFQYWANDNVDIGQIALGFITSQEYKTKSGVDFDTLDISAKIETFYEALLGRTSDSDGKSHWINLAQSGAMSIDQIANGFINSLEMQGIYLQKDGWDFIV